MAKTIDEKVLMEERKTLEDDYKSTEEKIKLIEYTEGIGVVNRDNRFDNIIVDNNNNNLHNYDFQLQHLKQFHLLEPILFLVI